MITCRTLGPVEVLVDGDPAPSELLWRKNLALLLYLARSPKGTRTRDHLMALLWGEKPETAARHSLREAMRVIRKAAGDTLLSTRGEQVTLSSTAVAGLYLGEFLEGFGVPDATPFEDWLLAERDEWRRRGVGALVHHATSLAERGAIDDGVAVATRAADLEPGSDAAARCLVRMLALAGDRGGALARYEAFIAHLQEFGAAPEHATEELAERVRQERTWHLPSDLPRGAEAGAESRRTPLVGRDDDLRTLIHAWQQAVEGGRAAALVVTGDAGAGKTRLVEEVEARARLAGTTVVKMRAVPADTDTPGAGLVPLARGGLLDAAGISAAPPEALAALSARIIEWAERFPARGGEPLPLDAAVSEIVRAALAEQPVMLIVDDAQWLDRSTADALRSMLRDCASLPCIVMVAAVTHPPHPVFDALRADIGRDVEGVAVRAAPLGRESLELLAGWAMPAYSADDRARLARRLVADTAGLPVLVVEILHALALGLDLGTADGAWPEPQRTLDQTMPGDLPDAIVAAIRTGFRGLSVDGQQILRAAAVADRPVDGARLGRAVDLAGDALACALDETEWQRWLQASPRGYDFVARILGEVIARDMMTDGQRQRLAAALDAS
jgi:DNA-binding SARP family transcriptional activator